MKQSSQHLAIILLALSFGMSNGAVTGQQAAPDPAEWEHDVILSVARFMEGAHISGRLIDDAISQRTFQKFLDGMDPLKLYFMKSDVVAFSTLSNDLDNMVKQGDASFAHLVHKRFVLRVRERVKWAQEFIQAPHDFTVDEEFEVEPAVAVYAADDAQGKDRWRRRIKLDILGLRADKVEEKEIKDRLERRYTRFLRRVEQMDRSEVVSGFLNAVTESFDPHTSYMAPHNFENFEIRMRLNYQGIGAHIRDEDGYTTISSIIPGGAAAKDGRLKDGDRIVAIGQGKEGPMVDIVGMKLNDSVQLIRGGEGTIVRLDVRPAAGGTVRNYALLRSKIQLEDSAAKGEVVEFGKHPEGRPMKIGIVDLPSFYRDTEAQHAHAEGFRSSARDVRKILEGFKGKGVDAVVVDLRYNGGGYLPEAVEVTGLFIDQGPVVLVKSPGRRVGVLDDDDRGMAWSGPLVVLTSRVSASASEILAGAVRDYRRGIVVGDESTHGKGTVQTVLDLAAESEKNNSGPLGALKLTFRQFYRPDGESTQVQGVPSDVTISSWTGALATGEGELDYALPFDKVGGVRHDDYGWVTPEVTGKLNEASRSRRRASEYFSKLDREIATYKRLRARKTISLNEKKYMAAQKELEAGGKAEDELSAPEGAPKKSPYQEPWFQEVLQITSDYCALMKGRHA